MPVSTREKATEVPELLPVGFVSLLRSLGLNIPIGSVITFQQALGKVGVSDRESVYWAGRTTLITDPEDISVYDQAFQIFWEGLIDVSPEFIPAIQKITLVADDETPIEEGAVEETQTDGEVINLRYSPSEILRDKDFALYTSEELDEAYELAVGDFIIIVCIRFTFQSLHQEVGEESMLRFFKYLSGFFTSRSGENREVVRDFLFSNLNEDRLSRH